MKQLAEDIRQNNFKQVYLLFGEERYLRRYYKDKLRTALCADGDTMNTHHEYSLLRRQGHFRRCTHRFS